MPLHPGLRFRWCAFIFVAVMALTGCSSTIDGAPARAPGTVTADGVELELLDPGNYPSEPLPAFGPAPAGQTASLLEAARLAEYVVLPTTVDPTLVNGSRLGESIADADDLDDLLPVPYDAPTNTVVEAARRHNFVTGYASVRNRTDTGPDRLGMENAVLIFPDDAAAKAAAAEMAAAFATAWPDIPGTPLPIPNHPDAVAFSDDFGSGPQVKSFTPYGRYVLFERVGAPTIEAAAQLIATTIDAQRTLIDGFTLTDPAKYVDLPRDPTGVLARTLPETDYLTTGSGRVFTPKAWLHNTTDPLAASELFDDIGLVAVALTPQSTVYETSQDDGGARLRDALAENAAQSQGLEPAAAVPGMPNVSCFVRPPVGEGASEAFWCFGAAGKYAYVVSDVQELAIHQKAAAQYLMLTAP